MFPTRRIITSGIDKFRDEYFVEFVSNDYLTIGQYDYDANASWAFWFANRNDAGGSFTSYIFTQGTDSDNKFQIKMGSRNSILASTVEGGVYKNLIKIDATKISPNKWAHIVMTRDKSANSFKIYINGEHRVQSSTNEHAMSFTGEAVIGADWEGLTTNEFQGGIADFAIYNTTLSPSQVIELYNNHEPFDHKSGSASSNLKYWGRMGDDHPLSGDGSLEHPNIIRNHAEDITSAVIFSSTFDSDEDGWEATSGETVARSTDIVTRSGSAGVLKSTSDGTDDICIMASNLTDVEAGKLYIVRFYCYVPATPSPGTNYIQIDVSEFDTRQHLIFDLGFTTVKDQWQFVEDVFRIPDSASDVTGKVKIEYYTASTVDSGDIIYIDDFEIVEVTNPGAAIIPLAKTDPNPIRVKGDYESPYK